jgi:isopropylmalate/homocitrate/citramalate synthase
MFTHPPRVTVVEVGPRDGLQNERGPVGTADKIAFIDLLSATGLRIIEASAFVSPKWVPQMADAAEVFSGIARRPGTEYTALVPNVAGLERAHAAGVREVAVFAAASESFSRKNINKSIAESIDAYREICERAAQLDIRVRGYVSTAFGCPFEGAVAPSRVADVSHALLAMGVYQVAVSDTIGIAHPRQVGDVIKVVADRIPRDRIALHFHDTRGTALANVLAALDLGISTFDSSAGGLGGCPYAPGATGNLATEDLVYMLDGLGIETGVELNAVVRASEFIEPRIGHPLPSRYYRAAVSARA